MPDVCVRRSVAGGAPPRAGHRRREVQRVLHVARGMLRRHVERFEVVVIVLELRPLDDQETHAEEDRLDALAQERQRMPVPEERRASRQRDVDRVARRAARGRLRQALGQRGVDVLLELVRVAAEGGTDVGRRRRDLFQQRRR